MWLIVLTLCLLDPSFAAPLPWEQSSLQQVFQPQVYQTTPSPSQNPPVGRRRTTSSSSSSSSSSESSQSSEGVQHQRGRQRLQNTVVETVDSSQEIWDRLTSNSHLWINELVLLGKMVGERGGERDTGDDSMGSAESRQRALMLSFHPLMTRPRRPGGEPGHDPNPGVATAEADVAVTEVGVADGEMGVADAEEGGVRGAEEGLPDLSDHSMERGGALTYDSPGHNHDDYYGNGAELELRL